MVKKTKKKKKEISEKNTKKLKLTNPILKSGIDVSKIVDLSSITNQNKKFLAGVRNPVSDTEKMWVVSWWENRKTLDPNFDPDNWFISSVHIDNKERNKQIENFWTGRAEQDTEDFWTGPTMWQRKKQL